VVHKENAWCSGSGLAEDLDESLFGLSDGLGEEGRPCHVDEIAREMMGYSLLMEGEKRGKRKEKQKERRRREVP